MLIQELKKTLRDNWKKHYPKDLATRDLASRKVCSLVLASPFFQMANRVGLFYPFSWEIDLLPLWQVRPKACVFPKIDKKTGQMDFFHLSHLKELTKGYAEIMEPPSIEMQRVANWNETDLILVPGYAFDIYGGRIGSGKGFYDRFFAGQGQASIRWGTAFFEQFHKEELAQEKTDVRMDFIVTDQGVFPRSLKIEI